MDLVNFRVGPKTVALHILDILLTERFENNLTTIPSDDGSFVGVKDYMNIPTPIFDLGMIMNHISSRDTIHQLLDTLKAAQRAHEEWIGKLEDSIRRDMTFSGARDPHQCDFGKWRDNFKTDNQDLLNILEKFDAPHHRLHRLASELLDNNDLSKDAKLTRLKEEKTNTYGQLKRLFDTALEQVQLSYKPIIVFTTKDGQTPYIGLLVDGVEDSMSVQREEIKSLDTVMNSGSKVDNQIKTMLKGIVTRQNVHSLLLDPAAIFRPELSLA